MPSRQAVRCFDSRFPSPCFTAFINSLSEQMRKFTRVRSLGGVSYTIFGSIRLTEETSSVIRFMLSVTRYTPSFFAISIILLCLPIISAVRRFTTISPISFMHSKSKFIIRSSPSCVISSSFPPLRCFLRSMQNIGGADGFSAARSVIHTRADIEFELISILLCFPALRIEIIISSREG